MLGKFKICHRCFAECLLYGYKKQEGHDGPVSLYWLIHEIPSYQALQYLGIGLKHRTLTRTKIGSHSSYVKHQEYFERLHHMKPCKTL